MCRQIRPFGLDDDGQKLIFQPHRSDHKVDHRSFGLDFGGEVGVGELGVQEQPEVGVLLDLVVTQKYDAAIPPSDESSGYNRQHHGVNGFPHIFDDDGMASFHGLLEIAE